MLLDSSLLIWFKKKKKNPRTSYFASTGKASKNAGMDL